MKIKDLLRQTGRTLITIGPRDTITAAVKKLAEHDRGSLPVIDEKGELVGIVTERDIIRKCFTRADTCAGARAEDIMTKQVAVGVPDDDIEYAISVMKQKRVRHLPIVDGRKVVGIVSMRDLLDVQLSQTKAEIRYASMLPRRGGSRLTDMHSES